MFIDSATKKRVSFDHQDVIKLVEKSDTMTEVHFRKNVTDMPVLSTVVVEKNISEVMMKINSCDVSNVAHVVD